MSKVRFKYTFPGYYDLRTEERILDELDRHAEAIMEASGPGYSTGPASARAKTSRVGVYTETFEAMLDNARHQTLLKNLEAGRG